MDVVNSILNVHEVPRLVDVTLMVAHRIAKNETPIGDTGSMAASNRAAVYIRPFRHVRGRLWNTDPAAWWVNRGTGLHSRDGDAHLITPRTHQYMRFPPRRFPPIAGGSWVYAKSTEGQPANEFLLRSLRLATRVSPQRWTVQRVLP